MKRRSVFEENIFFLERNFKNFSSAPVENASRTWTLDSFLPYLKTSLAPIQYEKINFPAGLSLLNRYCSLFQEWEDTLLQKLSSDWEEELFLPLYWIHL